MGISIQCANETALNEAASLLLSNFKEERIFAFYGEMGAGKTTFIRYIVKHLGSGDQVGSPTYGLINEYEIQNGNIIYHFDFYRISDLAEAIDIGTDEYLSSGNYCLIEWPEKIAALLPPRFVKISISPDGNTRIIDMEIKG